MPHSWGEKWGISPTGGAGSRAQRYGMSPNLPPAADLDGFGPAANAVEQKADVARNSQTLGSTLSVSHTSSAAQRIQPQ